jgi:ribosomal protein S1
MQGVIELAAFETPPKEGAQFDFALKGQEDGLWVLSLDEAKTLAAWNEIEIGARVKARVSGQNTGGLELKVGPLSAFMPASQAGLGRVEDLSTLIGQHLECAVLEYDRQKKRLLLSRRAVLEEERAAAREESLGSLSVGQTVTGKVTRIEPFGAFVAIGGGLEGLLHVSNMAHARVEDPNEVVKAGQELQVMVLSIQEGGRRIGLGLKQLQEDPWKEAAQRYPAGQIVRARVVRLTDFGAFLELEPGLDGLLHVSQMARERVRRPQDAVKMGEELSVRVVAVDTARSRISLSRLDERGSLLGSDEAADGADIDQLLASNDEAPAKTNLGSLFRKALGGDRPRS